jgi:hypothetical protein
MSSEAKGTTATPDKDITLERAKFLWDEYRYRHEHCWKLIFQITAAVVIVSIIPYIKVDIARRLGYWIVSLPALGIVLSLFSMLRLNRELAILDGVREKHRELQESLYGIPYKKEGSAFSRDVKLYLGSLVLLGVADIIAIAYVWIPNQR